MDIRVPDVLRRVVRVLATDDDSTVTDTLLSVGLLVVVATALTPLLTHVLPIVPAFVATPLTAGILAVIVDRLS